MWDCIAGIAAMGGLGVTQPWPATAEVRFPKRGWLSATRSVQQSGCRLSSCCRHQRLHREAGGNRLYGLGARPAPHGTLWWHSRSTFAHVECGCSVADLVDESSAPLLQHRIRRRHFTVFKPYTDDRSK